MSAKHERSPISLYRDACYIGEPPSAMDTAIRAQAMVRYLRKWIMSSTGFVYSGPPLRTVNPVGGSFYLIHSGAVQGASAARQVRISVSMWGQTQTDLINYYPDMTATTAADAIRMVWFGYNEVPNWYSSKTWGGDYTDGSDSLSVEVPLTWVPSGGAYVASRLDYTYSQVAALSVYEEPQWDLPGTQWIAALEDVQAGAVARGYTGTGRASIGDIIHYLGSSEWNSPGDITQPDTVDAATQRCLFQTGHPVGRYTALGSFLPVFGSQFRCIITPRNLYLYADTDDQDVPVYPAVVVSGTGRIQFSITTDTATYTAYYSHASATAALIQPASFTGSLAAQLGQRNEVTIEAKAENDGEFIVHTVSLWEGSQQP